MLTLLRSGSCRPWDGSSRPVGSPPSQDISSLCALLVMLPPGGRKEGQQGRTLWSKQGSARKQRTHITRTQKDGSGAWPIGYCISPRLVSKGGAQADRVGGNLVGEPWRGLVSSYEVSSWLTRPLTCARYDSRFAPEPSWKLGERKHALICWTSNTDVRRERSTLPSKNFLAWKSHWQLPPLGEGGHGMQEMSAFLQEDW